MSTYQLKDKINITKEFLSDLVIKGWQEIEHLQNQIANIEVTEENKQVVQLLKNLLTSYYVFTGGVESLESDTVQVPVTKFEVSTKEPELVTIEPEEVTVPVHNKLGQEKILNDYDDVDTDSSTVFEPFEYFIDFDEPLGEPLSDEDLYGN